MRSNNNNNKIGWCVIVIRIKTDSQYANFLNQLEGVFVKEFNRRISVSMNEMQMTFENNQTHREFAMHNINKMLFVFKLNKNLIELN